MLGLSSRQLVCQLEASLDDGQVVGLHIEEREVKIRMASDRSLTLSHGSLVRVTLKVFVNNEKPITLTGLGQSNEERASNAVVHGFGPAQGSHDTS